MKKAILLITAILFPFLLAIDALAQASPAGKVSFEDLSEAYGEAKVEINLNTAMLRLVAQFAQGGDPELQQLLSSLEGVTVRVYNIGNSQTVAIQTLEKVTKRIQKDNWLPIVSVNEHKEKIRIFTKMTNDKMDGLVVMVIDNNEAVFINIVGQIDPAKVGAVAQTLGVHGILLPHAPARKDTHQTPKNAK